MTKTELSDKLEEVIIEAAVVTNKKDRWLLIDAIQDLLADEMLVDLEEDEEDE